MNGLKRNCYERCITYANAVDAGFSGALAVILDANITTFIVGAVLYYLGSLYSRFCVDTDDRYRCYLDYGSCALEDDL